MSDLIDRAHAFAHRAHDSIGQVRKYSGEPYWKHTDRVAALAQAHGLPDEAIAAAHLHDTVEDVPGITRDTIAAEFGERVADLVMMQTAPSKPGDGNRAARKMIDRHHYASADADGQSVKLCDLIDNTEDIVAHDHGFARVYLREKAALLPLLTLGHPALRVQAQAALEAGVMAVDLWPEKND